MGNGTWKMSTHFFVFIRRLSTMALLSITKKVCLLLCHCPRYVDTWKVNKLSRGPLTHRLIAQNSQQSSGQTKNANGLVRNMLPVLCWQAFPMPKDDEYVLWHDHSTSLWAVSTWWIYDMLVGKMMTYTSKTSANPFGRKMEMKTFCFINFTVSQL